MAMSITFSSCSKGGDDDFLPNGGGTEVNGGSTQPLTDDDIVSLNDAYNSGNTTTFINALESKGCIAKVAQTRSGGSDAKYVLTEKGKEYFKYDLFAKKRNIPLDYVRYIDTVDRSFLDKGAYYAFSDLTSVFQGWYPTTDDEVNIKGEYKWVSLDNPNNWFECPYNDKDFYWCFGYFYIKYRNSWRNEYGMHYYYKCYWALRGYEYHRFFNGDENGNGAGHFKNERLNMPEDYDGISFSKDTLKLIPYYMGTTAFLDLKNIDLYKNEEIIKITNVRSKNDYIESGNGWKEGSDPNNVCIVEIFSGLYIRVPKTNK